MRTARLRERSRVVRWWRLARDPTPAHLHREGPLQDAPRPPAAAGDLRRQGRGPRPRGGARRVALPAPGVRGARRPGGAAESRPARVVRGQAHPRQRCGHRGLADRAGRRPTARARRIVDLLPRPTRGGRPAADRRPRRRVARAALRPGPEQGVGVRAGPAPDPGRGAAGRAGRGYPRRLQVLRLPRPGAVRPARRRSLRSTHPGLLHRGLGPPAAQRRTRLVARYRSPDRPGSTR